MALVLDPSGRLGGPVIRTSTKPFYRNLREQEGQSYGRIMSG